MHPAPYGATHDKLTSNTPVVRWRGCATIAVFCLSPASHGSKVLESAMRLIRRDLCHLSATIALRSIGVLRAAFSRVVGGGFIELAIECRAADLQPARDLRHLSAIVRNGEADDLVFHLFQRSHLAGGGQQRQAAGVGQRRNRYFITRD